MIDFKALIIEELKKHAVEGTLEIPPDQKLGDFAFPCFPLAKVLRKAPPMIAKELSEKIKLDFARVEANGPYLNFFIFDQVMAKVVIAEIFEKKLEFGKSQKKDEKVMIEYSSPNTNKAQHLGHVRNNLLGKSIANILEFNGYKVIKTCLMNDKGMGVAKTIYSFMTWHKGEEPKKKTDHYVADLYVEFQQKEKENPELEKEAQKVNQLFEQNDPEIMKYWKKITDWVYLGYDETYRRLGCDFDKTYHESAIYKEGKNIVYAGKEKGIFVEDEGAIVADLEQYGLPKKVLIKSDGTSIYITQDIYLAELKEKEFGMDRSIYVVGSEQELHFKQLFKILELLGKRWAKKCYHLSYGMIELPSGRMKSREGTVVDADDLIEEMVKISREEIQKRHILATATLNKRSEIIGMGALKFYILKYEPSRGFVYNPEESISFEGETGPYIQYVFARIHSIFRKYGHHPSPDVDFTKLCTPEEAKLLRMIYRYPEFVLDAGNQYKPSIIARFLIEFAQSFNEFYHTSQVNVDDEETKKARIALCYCVQNVIESGLLLLGIKCPDEM